MCTCVEMKMCRVTIKTLYMHHIRGNAVSIHRRCCYAYCICGYLYCPNLLRSFHSIFSLADHLLLLLLLLFYSYMRYLSRYLKKMRISRSVVGRTFTNVCRSEIVNEIMNYDKLYNLCMCAYLWVWREGDARLFKSISEQFLTTARPAI